MLVAPGNVGDVSMRAGLAAALAARGMWVLLLDYAATAATRATRPKAGLALDVRAAWSYLVEDLEVPPERQMYSARASAMRWSSSHVAASGLPTAPKGNGTQPSHRSAP
jgi:hypothetical protein